MMEARNRKSGEMRHSDSISPAHALPIAMKRDTLAPKAPSTEQSTFQQHISSPSSDFDLLLKAADRVAPQPLDAKSVTTIKGFAPVPASLLSAAAKIIGAPSISKKQKTTCSSGVADAVDRNFASDEEETQQGNDHFAAEVTEALEALGHIKAAVTPPTLPPSVTAAAIVPTSDSCGDEGEYAAADDDDESSGSAGASAHALTALHGGCSGGSAFSRGQRLHRPCAACRLAKVRCDRLAPCTRCSHLKIMCQPPPHVRRGRPPGRPWSRPGGQQCTSSMTGVGGFGPLGVAPYEEGALDVHVSQLPSVTMRSTSTSLGVTSTVAALGGFSLARGMNLAAAGADMSSIGMGPLAGPAHPLASATAHELPPHPIMPQLSSALTGGGQLQPHQTATVVAVGPYAHAYAYAQQQAVPLQPLPSASLMTLGSGKVHGGNFFEHERVGQPSPKQQRAPRSVIRGPTTVAPLSSSASSWTPSHMGTWNPDAVASLIANTAPPSAAEAAALRAQLLQIGVKPCV